MSLPTYKIVYSEDPEARKLTYEDGHPLLRTGQSALVEYKGRGFRVLGTDGGEPEDQLLVRDWAWVIDAIRDAQQVGYDEGLADGNEEGYERGVADAR